MWRCASLMSRNSAWKFTVIVSWSVLHHPLLSRLIDTPDMKYTKMFHHYLYRVMNIVNENMMTIATSFLMIFMVSVDSGEFLISVLP